MTNSSSYCYNSCQKNPIFYIFLLKKKIQKKKNQKKNSKKPNWAIFDFSLIGSSVFELWPKNCKSGKAGVHLTNRKVLYCPTVSVIHRWSHRMLLPAFYLWSFLLDTQWATEKGRRMYAVREALEEWGCGAGGRLFILFSQALDLFSRSTVGIFPTISFVLQMVGKSLTMDLENRSSAWEKKYK